MASISFPEGVNARHNHLNKRIAIPDLLMNHTGSQDTSFIRETQLFLGV